MSQLLLPARSSIRNTIHCGDCLDVMYWLWRQGVQVDAIITDLPYGTTACSWDEIIPFAPMWKQVKRILKPRGVFVTTATEPFASLLRVSNLEWFKYDWVWKKTRPFDIYNCKNKPLKIHESILVFSFGDVANGALERMEYYPQGLIKTDKKWSRPRKYGSNHNVDRPSHSLDRIIEYENYPTTVIEFPNPNNNSLHPTEKPLDLYEYLVRTYTQPGELVLDITAGSGTTGVACVKTGRDFILIDSSQEYCDIAHKRIHAGFVTVDVAEGVKQPSLFELAGATL